MAILGLNHTFEVLQETGRSDKSLTLIIDTADGEKKECFPRSVCKPFPLNRHGKTTWHISVPDWLAQKKGLV